MIAAAPALALLSDANHAHVASRAGAAVALGACVLYFGRVRTHGLIHNKADTVPWVLLICATCTPVGAACMVRLLLALTYASSGWHKMQKQGLRLVTVSPWIQHVPLTFFHLTSCRAGWLPCWLPCQLTASLLRPGSLTLRLSGGCDLAGCRWATGKNLQRMVAQFMLELQLLGKPLFAQRLILTMPLIAAASQPLVLVFECCFPLILLTGSGTTEAAFAAFGIMFHIGCMLLFQIDFVRGGPF